MKNQLTLKNRIKPRLLGFDDFDTVFDNILDLTPFRGSLTPKDGVGSWDPFVDVYKEDGNFVVRAELPGLSKEDITLAVEGGQLVISGEKTYEKTIDKENFYWQESASGSFQRTVELPAGAKEEDIQATYKGGVLRVVLPLKDEPAKKSHQIKIK